MMKFKKLFYSNILVYILFALFAALIFPGTCYSQSNALRVPIGNYTRPGDYITQTVLTRQVFPLSFLREIFSETGIKIEYRNKQGALESIDLSFPGINDGIVIRFAKRVDLGNKPFTKTESDKEITYTIAQDITFNETRYLLADMDSILERYGNRLTLSNTFSLRLKQLAIYLAKNMDLEASANNKSNNLKREIESLYLLGLTLDSSNIIKPGNPISPFSFEKIKSQDCLYETDILDYMKANNLFTSLTSGNTKEFIGNIRKIMIKEAIIAMRINFNSRIYSKGVEKLFSELEIPEKRGLERLFLKIYSKLKEYLEILQNDPVSKLLKDNLPIEDWRNRLKNATGNEEVEIVKEIVKIVDKYPGWKNKRTINAIIKYSLSMQKMNCFMRTILLSRIFKEIGIGEDRLYTASFPEHAFLIMKLNSGDYLEIQTTENAFNDTKILPRGIKADLDDAVKKAKLLGSANLTLKKPLWKYSPQSKVITISNNLEGLIENSYVNLAFNFVEESQLTKGQKIKLYKMKFLLLQEATDINPNDVYAFYYWGVALNYLATIEQDDTNPEEAIKYLNEAIEKIEEALRITPQDSEMKTFLEILRGEKELLELVMIRNALRTAL